MSIRKIGISAMALAFALSFGIANASTSLSVSCAGVPAASSITWTATTAGGVSPVAILWGNGSTSTAQTVSYTPGTYSMTVQATDASSSVATSTCSAVVVASALTSAQVSAIVSLLQSFGANATIVANVTAALNGQATTGTGGTTAPPIMPPGQAGKNMCISLNRDLGEGDSGDDVRQVQQILANDPQAGFDVAPTGFFGPLTARAMARFQEDSGIASSTIGNVGPLTRGFFHRRCGEGLGNNPSEGEAQNQNASSDGSSSASSTEQSPMMHTGNSSEDGQSGHNSNRQGHDN